MKKQVLFFLLMLMPLMASAQTKINGIYYNLNSSDKVAEVTSVPYGTSKYMGSIVIPRTVTYGGVTYSVTSIGVDAFFNCSDLTSITIPNSVTSIGNSVFSDCSSLTSITVENGNPVYDSRNNCNAIVKTLTNELIVGCNSTIIPNSVTSIGDWAFYSCSGLTSVTIPNSVTSLGSYAFCSCSCLTSMTIPNSVISIGHEAFSGCSGLTSITIPNSVTSIGHEAFYSCSGLTSITVENGNPIYDSRNNCNAIVKTLTNELIVGCNSTIIPNSVTSLGSYAFEDCPGLTSITIPNSVTSIGDGAFFGCSGLTSITIPNSVTSIGEGAFSDCSGLTSITIPTSVTSIGYGTFSNCSGLTSITIPTSVTSIGNSAFYSCSGLTSITIPNSVTSIGDGTFSYCSGLTSITIPTSVTGIGNYAFEGCSGLTSVTIPTSMTSIGNSAFEGCSGLTSVTIPTSVTSIGDGAFFDCISIEKITLHCQEIGSWFSNLKSIKEVFIGDEVKTIDANAFSGCSGLTSVTIGNSVTSIGTDAFKNCSSLTSVKINDLAAWCKIVFNTTSTNPLSYAKHLYLNEEEVKDLVVPNGVTSISNYAFYNCSSLSSVVVPNSVTSIGSSAFSGCSRLTFVEILGSVTSIGTDAFKNCSSLTSVKINDLAAWCKISFNTTSTNPLSYAKHLYLNGEEVKDLVVPNDVTTISNYAFYNCSSLSSVVLPSRITNIGIKAFANCPEIKKVYCYAKNVPTISNDTFVNSYYIKFATLYVPETSVDLYKASLWSQFGAIEPLANEILFADDAVKALCVANWDTNNDGELGMDEAAAVTDLGSVFANNTDITSFEELQYFTGLTSIGEQAFYYCSNLISIIIPENVTTIGNRAFYVCSGLKSLRIPASVSNIEDRAFAYCSGLETIKVDDNNQNYDSRNNCNALIQTNSNTLLVGCKNTVIPSSVKIIAEGAFRGCTELASIEIPEGVTTIGANAFRGCTGLTSVTLPSTITNIGNYAFSAVDDVYNLTSVTVGMTTPVAITSEVFPNRANSTLYVPKGSMAAYKAANYWKEFKNIVELEDGVPVKCEKPVITLLVNGKVKVECATEGATCKTTITASNAEPLTDGEISLSTPLTVYTVTSYATKEGYDDSEVATTTFRYEKSEGDINGDGNLNISDVVQLVNMILSK